MNYFLAVLKKYAVFSGRARRAEYWYFYLFSFIFAIVFAILDIFIPLPKIMQFGFLNILYLLVIFVPSLAVVVRRLHDIGKSGWMILISLIPIVGGIWLLILMFKDSNPGDNKYGPNPKMVLSSTPTVSPEPSVLSKQTTPQAVIQQPSQEIPQQTN